VGDHVAHLPSTPIYSGKLHPELHTSNDNNVSVHLHALELGGKQVEQNSGMYVKLLRRRAEFLFTSAPTDIHVVRLGNNIICIGDGKIINAGNVLKLLLQRVGGHGGGSKSVGQGKLNSDVSHKSLQTALFE